MTNWVPIVHAIVFNLHRPRCSLVRLFVFPERKKINHSFVI